MNNSLTWLLISKRFSQVLRYSAVGVANNLLGYLVYLLLTWLGLDPKIAVILLYPIAATTAYVGHAKYSFSNEGRHMGSLPRYISAYVVGFLTNIFLLYVFVEKFFFPHQLVQAVAIIVVGGILFLLFKYFVFPSNLLQNQ